MNKLPEHHEQVKHSKTRQQTAKPRRVEKDGRAGWKLRHDQTPDRRPGEEEQEETHVDQVAHVDDDDEEASDLHRFILA